MKFNIVTIGMFLLAATFHVVSVESTPDDGLLASAISLESTLVARLPNTLAPASYILELMTDFDNDTFGGAVTIKIICNEPTKAIVLHSKELTIIHNDVTLNLLENNQPTKKIDIQNYSFDVPNDFYQMNIGEDLLKGNYYQLYIPFSGNLRDDSQGYFKNVYLDEAGQQRTMALTYLMPNNARLVTPCFDEPAMKASFLIKLTHASTLSAFSNMIRSESKPDPNNKNLVIDSFKESPVLPSYVIAFMLSELEVKEFKPDEKSILMNIIVRKEFSNQVTFANTVSNKALTFFGTYFNFLYPNEKLDIGIIPGFPLNVTKNFGFIHVSESPILLDENTASIFNKYDAASTICTGIVNHWLGDIVTVKWWDDFWLIIAFGDYFSITCVDNVSRQDYPSCEKPFSNFSSILKIFDWKSADLNFLRKFQNTIEADILTTSHPVAAPISDPKEVNIYDTITYEKGPCLLRMTNLLLGEENFQKSISAYINKYKFSTATSDDLWDIMTSNAHASEVIPNTLSMKIIMDSWLLQAGYPALKVTIDYQTKKVLVNQERFFSKSSGKDSGSGTDQELQPCWVIPLSFTTSKELKFETTARQWLDCLNGRQLEIQLDLTETDWLILNIRMEVPLQILYEEKNIAAIQTTLNDANTLQNIEVLSRVQLIIDAFTLAKTGDMKYKATFDLINYLKLETEYLPWRAGLRKLSEIRYLLLRTDIFKSFQKHIRSLLEPTYLKFGKITDLSKTNYNEVHFKTFVIFWARTYSIEDCIKQSLDIFHQWMTSSDPDKNNPVPLDLKETVYCQGAQENNKNNWNFLYDRYKNSKDPTELSRVSAGLACSSNIQTLEMYLDWSLDNTKIRKEESLWVFSSVSKNDIAFKPVKKFLMGRFNDIFEYHNGDTNTLTSYIAAFATLIMHEDELKELKDFLDKEKDRLKNVDVQSSIEQAENNIEWQKMHYDEISKLFVS